VSWPIETFRFRLGQNLGADLTQLKGWQFSFHASRKRWMASRSARTFLKTPRRMARAFSSENQISTWFIQLPLVGVK